MRSEDQSGPQIHHDEAFFKEAINFTAAHTGFSPRVIEKDYYCTVVLFRLAAVPDTHLVFKGGTCLAKIHAEFYRMSEDLDFVIPMDVDCNRIVRSRKTEGAKEALLVIHEDGSGLKVVQPLRGANQSKQYLGSVGYRSIVLDRDETIKIEVGLREPLLRATEYEPARTALLDPVTAKELVRAISIPCVSKGEAFAEKYRAALTRREVAIRDFYDIYVGVTRLEVRPTDPEMMSLIQSKLAVPGNDPPDVSEARMSALQRQIATRLRPVLRAQDYEEFDLGLSIDSVRKVAELLL